MAIAAITILPTVYLVQLQDKPLIPIQVSLWHGSRATEVVCSASMMSKIQVNQLWNRAKNMQFMLPATLVEKYGGT